MKECFARSALINDWIAAGVIRTGASSKGAHLPGGLPHTRNNRFSEGAKIVKRLFEVF